MSLLSPAAQGTALEPAQIAGIEFGSCPVSGGIWLSRSELEKFDDATDPVAAMDCVQYDHCFEGDTDSPRVSPYQPDTVMDRHVVGHRHPIEVHTCPASGGIWLDRCEIERVRHYYADHADLRELAVTLDNELDENTGGGRTTNTERFCNLFRWICVAPIARAS